MNATLISKEKTAVKLSFEVSAEVLEQGMAFAYNKHKNNLSLPGFRKGKVPRKLIEAQYGEGFSMKMQSTTSSPMNTWQQ